MTDGVGTSLAWREAGEAKEERTEDEDVDDETEPPACTADEELLRLRAML